MKSTDHGKATIITRILQSALSVFAGGRRALPEEAAHSEKGIEKLICEEIDRLWEMSREVKGGTHTGEQLKDAIVSSFLSAKSRYTDEELNDAFAWPRYAKIAILCLDDPLQELVDHVTESNYQKLSCVMVKQIACICETCGERGKRKAEHFAETVYMHIIRDIDPTDAPACFYLGKIALEKGAFRIAREWYGRATEAEKPYGAAMALLRTYDEEVKAIIEEGRRNHCMDASLWTRVNKLNNQRSAETKKWIALMEKRLEDPEEATIELKGLYVSMMINFARHKRHAGHFEEASHILERIPEDYPDRYRVYAEEGMLCQNSSRKNPFHDPEKAVERLTLAYETIGSENPHQKIDAVSRKSILMPLANTYFVLERYSDADRVCDEVLAIDEKEKNAILLKKRITDLALQVA